MTLENGFVLETVEVKIRLLLKSEFYFIFDFIGRVKLDF